jgi:tRNA 2-thiouridine synthesizing protein A
MKADKELVASGLACLNLTPDIKKAISPMQPNHILKVMNDDPASREGVPAWCRLTGNTLLAVEELNEKETLFYIKKKNS